MEQLEQSKPQFSTNQVFGILKTCEDGVLRARCSPTANRCSQIISRIKEGQFLSKSLTIHCGGSLGKAHLHNYIGRLQRPPDPPGRLQGTGICILLRSATAEVIRRR
jgi:hypothetical protein